MSCHGSSKSQPKRLTYFNKKGTAETIRLVLAQAGVEYEDERIEFGEAWTRIKKERNYAFDLPVYYDGKKLHRQSKSILRFLARKYGLYSTKEVEIEKIDEILEDLDDINKDMPFLKENAEKTAILKNLFETKDEYPDKLAVVNGLIAGPFVLGKKMTVADLSIYRTVEALLIDLKVDDRVPGASNKLGKMYEVYKEVEKSKKIAQYLKNRKDTPF